MLTRTLAEEGRLLLLPKPLPKQDKPILKTYEAMSRQARQPTTNKAEAAKQSQPKPPQTETQAKNLEANFSDWTKPT